MFWTWRMWAYDECWANFWETFPILTYHLQKEVANDNKLAKEKWSNQQQQQQQQQQMLVK